MRIAFDGTTLRPGRTGVGYYTEHLLQHVAREQEPGDELVVLSNKPIATSEALPSGVRTQVASSRWPRMVWMQTYAPRMLRRLRADVAHFTNGMMPVASPVPTVVTIHDMSLTLYPRFHPPRRILLNRPLVGLAAERAAAVITVSQSARRDILRLYGLAPARVHVVHEAAAPWFKPIVDPQVRARVRRAYGLAERFLLYVGAIEPRKNLPTLIDAFADARRRSGVPHQLVCAGPYGWLCADIEGRVDRLGLTEAVRFTGYVPTADLPVLYSLAEMFVFPSMYEGFGLPVAEAMACGTPVVSGKVPALAEVAGGAAVLVDPLDAVGMADVILELSESPARRAQLSALGLDRSRAFSWTRAARETLAVYREAAGLAAHGTPRPVPAYSEVGSLRTSTPMARESRRAGWS
jgi:glycosyltransferase involved in cell wall biosynthesis